MAKKKRKKAKARTTRKPVRRKRTKNPTTLAKGIIGKVAAPGAKFSLSTLKAALRKYGYRNVKGWFDQMIRDAIRRRVISPASKTLYVYTPAAALNPCPYHRKMAKKKGKSYRR